MLQEAIVFQATNDSYYCRLEVRGSRELAFFPGVARGAVYPGFTYQTEAGTRAALIHFQARHPAFIGYLHLSWPHAWQQSHHCESLWPKRKEISDLGPLACLLQLCPLSRGLVVQEDGLTLSCRDYSNGGPAFFASGLEASHDAGCGPRPRNLATYAEGLGVAAVQVKVYFAPEKILLLAATIRSQQI